MLIDVQIVFSAHAMHVSEFQFRNGKKKNKQTHPNPSHIHSFLK